MERSWSKDSDIEDGVTRYPAGNGLNGNDNEADAGANQKEEHLQKREAYL